MGTVNKGYQLADGTWSTEYKVGDKFEVVEDGFELCVEGGSIVKLVMDNESSGPWFSVVEGSTDYDPDRVAEYWENLKAYKPKEFTKKDLKDGMWVTYRNGLSRLFLGERIYRQLSNGYFKTHNGMGHYRDNLLYQGTKELDIMKVEYMGEVLWEREEQTEEQKRIKELEECIKKAQEELNKMGVK